MDMASMADIRFVSETARFTMSYVKMGVVPGDGGAFYLPRLVGPARALHLMWTGELFGAQEAVDWGYALASFPPDELLPRTRDYAGKLANGPRVSIELIKNLVYRSLDGTEADALSMAAHAMALARSTADAQEGPRAFAEKRLPNSRVGEAHLPARSGGLPRRVRCLARRQPDGGGLRGGSRRRGSGGQRPPGHPGLGPQTPRGGIRLHCLASGVRGPGGLGSRANGLHRGDAARRRSQPTELRRRHQDRSGAHGLGYTGAEGVFPPAHLAGRRPVVSGVFGTGGGTDLASLRCAAVPDGDTFVVTGHKVWNSGGHQADYCELLVRTDPEAPKHAASVACWSTCDSPGWR